MKPTRSIWLAAVGLGAGALAALALWGQGLTERHEPPPVEHETSRPITQAAQPAPPPVEPSTELSQPPASRPTPKTALFKGTKRRHKRERRRSRRVATKVKSLASRSTTRPDPPVRGPVIREPMAMPARHRVLVERLWDKR